MPKQTGPCIQTEPPHESRPSSTTSHPYNTIATMTDNNTKISIFCNKVHRSNPITHTILQAQASPESRTNIVIITKPWICTIQAETMEKGMVNHPDWRWITPTNIKKVDVAIYYCKMAPFHVIPISHQEFAGDCLLLVQITIGDNFSAILIEVYNSPSTHNAINILQNSQIPETLIISV
jgi:hypothetical protein